MNNFDFECGAKVRDKITDFTGVIRARTQYLTGCNKYGVQSTELQDGKPAEWVWFDEDELEILGKPVPLTFDLRGKRPGGPLEPGKLPPR